ncbi:MAG: acyltransferase domain-containing protein [Prevotella sp.]|nr:acyltransferase domain-containing protein [Prevotella sp.]
MDKQIIVMFSGQGSQYYQMGRELYENNKEFKYWMDYCDKKVFSLIQVSLVDILYRNNKKNEIFDRLLYTSPALLSIEYSLFKLLESMNIKPHLLMGYSLGEIIACVVNETISLEDGIMLVINIAKLVEKNTAQASMLVIMSSKTILTEMADIFRDVELIGVNFKENFVVCGYPDDIYTLQQVLSKRNVISQVLPIKYGFHTKMIDPIESECKQLIRDIDINKANIPLISSLNTKSIDKFDEHYFWNVIRYPVNFETAAEEVLEEGDYVFIDAGPSGTLATFIKYLLPSNSNSISFQMINQFGKDLNSIEKLKSYFS